MGEATIEEAQEVSAELMPPPSLSPAVASIGSPGGVISERDSLVQQYHDGAPSLIEMIKAGGREDAEGFILALIDELIRETDNLLGNELYSTKNGDLKDATIISFKRAEVLEKIIKALQKKQDAASNEDIDLDSPTVAVLTRYLMGKVKETFEKIGAPTEMADQFFQSLNEETENWKKEVKEQFEELRP